MNKAERVEGEIELKCDAEKFFDVWCRKPYLVAQHCPNKYPMVKLQDGEWHKVGAIITWHYVCEDIEEKSLVTTKVEELDGEHKFVRYSYLDGLVLKLYEENLSATMQVSPKGEVCTVKWSFEYEKNQDVPDPTMYIGFLLGVAKDIGDVLCSA